MMTDVPPPVSEGGDESTVQIIDLTTDECRRLLASNHFGRIGITLGHQPTVLPVNYVVDGETIVVRTEEGSAVHDVVGRRVAFEIDGIDQFNHTGWSVIAVGDARLVHDISLDHARHLPLTSFEPGPKDLWIEITTPVITGRRITRP
jgi:hypothetical protein